jgi:D-glycero-D-manno-heptose 1,7-bisphosphate phosphatase
MILDARDALGLDLSRSVLVGDKDSDIEAGRAAGVRYGIKLLSAGEAASDPLAMPSLQAIARWLACAHTTKE